MRFLVLLLLLSSVVEAQSDDGLFSDFYSPHVELKASDFFGECDESKVEALDFEGTGICIANLVAPNIGNPLIVFEGFSGDAIKEKLDYLFDFSIENDSSILSSIVGALGGILLIPFKIIVLLLSSTIELIFNAMRYLLIFVFQFMKAYLIWFMLPYLSFFRVVTGRTLKLVEQAKVTVFIMVLGSIALIALGGAWINA